MLLVTLAIAFLLLVGFRSEFGLVLHLEDLANLSGLVIYLGNGRRRWPRGFVIVLWGRVELNSIFSWTAKGFISEHPTLDKNKAENIGKCRGKKAAKKLTWLSSQRVSSTSNHSLQDRGL